MVEYARADLGLTVRGREHLMVEDVVDLVGGQHV